MYMHVVHVTCRKFLVYQIHVLHAHVHEYIHTYTCVSVFSIPHPALCSLKECMVQVPQLLSSNLSSTCNRRTLDTSNNTSNRHSRWLGRISGHNRCSNIHVVVCMYMYLFQTELSACMCMLFVASYVSAVIH